MNMRYFRNHETNEVHGYDDNYENDLPYIEAAIAAGWEGITGSWPEPELMETINAS